MDNKQTRELLIEALSAIADSIDAGTSESVRYHMAHLHHEIRDEELRQQIIKTRMTTANVKEVRERTGMGIQMCRSNLLKAEGDVELAVRYIREGVGAIAKNLGGR